MISYSLPVGFYLQSIYSKKEKKIYKYIIEIIKLLMRKYLPLNNNEIELSPYLKLFGMVKQSMLITLILFILGFTAITKPTNYFIH